MKRKPKRNVMLFIILCILCILSFFIILLLFLNNSYETCEQNLGDYQDIPTTLLPEVATFKLSSDEWIPGGLFGDNTTGFPGQLFGDNITGFPIMIVPNIVHYVLFDIKVITFSHLISILSVLKHQKPDEIMIHCNSDKLSGNNWERVLKEAHEIGTKMTINQVKRPVCIFGKKIGFHNWHASDIVRIEILMKFGGIYLDQDVYICKSFDIFRKFEMVLDWDEKPYDVLLHNSILVANKNARFLSLWYSSYKWYKPDEWYYNAGQLPTHAILEPFPQLVHRVRIVFGTSGGKICPKIYNQLLPDWQQQFYSFHLLLRDHKLSWNDLCQSKVTWFDEQVVKTLNVTFGEMARLVLYGNKDIIND